MPSFLQRIGKKPLEKPLQVETIDEELRNSIWNVLDICMWEHWQDPPTSIYESARSDAAEELALLIRKIWTFHFKKPIDTIPGTFNGGRNSTRGILRTLVLEGEWEDVYALLDYIVSDSGCSLAEKVGETLNVVLVSENAGYRFVGSQLVPITTQVEIDAIETALERGSKAVRTHLAAAMAMLSDRKAPDYRNSIKESISAVEAACQVIAGRPKATLGNALSVIQKSKPMHGAFAEALKILYGYTSDAEHGIRHAMSDEATGLTKADAQFMLVSCSAFVNYLWSVAAETGIEVSA